MKILKEEKNYEQKKATKLGFPSLYAYFEDKILKEKQAVELKENKINENVNQDKVEKKKKKVAAVVKLISSLFFLF